MNEAKIGRWLVWDRIGWAERVGVAAIPSISPWQGYRRISP